MPLFNTIADIINPVQAEEEAKTLCSECGRPLTQKMITDNSLKKLAEVISEFNTALSKLWDNDTEPQDLGYMNSWDKTPDKIDWLINDRKCKKPFPDCSVCPGDTKVSCKYNESKNHETVKYERKLWRT